MQINSETNKKVHVCQLPKNTKSTHANKEENQLDNFMSVNID